MVTIRRSETSGEAAVAQRPAEARPWERNGAIDVEDLLVWAYRDQLVDRFAEAGLHVIERAAMGYEAHGSSTDGCAALGRIAHMGTRIDAGGLRVHDSVHPAAYAVAAAVNEVARGTSVAIHARAATRPEGWRRPSRMARPSVWVKHGVEGQVEYEGPGRKGAYCPVIILWSVEREAWGRADYTRWHGALEAISWALAGRALGFEVTGPAAPAEPWAAPMASASATRTPPQRVLPAASPANGVRQRGGLVCE